jgi:hypothetical protein
MELSNLRNEIWSLEEEIQKMEKKKAELEKRYQEETLKDVVYQVGWPGEYWLKQVKGHVPNPTAPLYKCEGNKSSNTEGILRALNYVNQRK